MSRKEFSAKTKVQAFARSKGLCEACQTPLSVGKFAYDHVDPDGLTGLPTLENCAVLCTGCHTIKTATDGALIAKAKRSEQAHLGAKVSRTPLPCGRKSKWKKQMDGSVVLR